MISPFTVFRLSTGEILRTGICPDTMVAIQAVEPDEIALAVETDATLHYIDVVTAEPRQKLPLPYTLSVSEGEIHLSDLPLPVTVCLHNPYQIIEVNDGELVLEVGLPGSYQLTLSAGPRYLPAELTVEVP